MFPHSLLHYLFISKIAACLHSPSQLGIMIFHLGFTKVELVLMNLCMTTYQSKQHCVCLVHPILKKQARRTPDRHQLCSETKCQGGLVSPSHFLEFNVIHLHLPRREIHRKIGDIRSKQISAEWTVKFWKQQIAQRCPRQWGCCSIKSYGGTGS